MGSKIKKILILLFCVFLLAILTIIPTTAKLGAVNGLVLCAEVIIPSLFPFAALVLLLMSLDIGEFLKPIEKITMAVFRLDSSQFAVFILALIGGYPIGARLVSKLYDDGNCDKTAANMMMCFCVNGGPAFIVLAIGETFLGSKKMGLVLLAAHIAASFIILILSRPFLNPYSLDYRGVKKPFSFSESFVSCVSNAAASTLNICSYVILFSAFGSYLLSVPALRKIFMAFELTNGILHSRNIYEVAFLLGFGGISIWFQIISLTKNFGLNVFRFIVSRLLHGTISVTIVYLILKLFPITKTVISNNSAFISRPIYSSVSVAVSLGFMMIIFLVSLFQKKYSGNLSNNIV